MYRAFMGKIRPGKQAEYIKAHEAVWPELLAAMRAAGVEHESCFVFENTIFVYVVAADMDATQKKLHGSPIDQKWTAYMEPLLEKPGASSNELFPAMQEVFCL